MAKVRVTVEGFRNDRGGVAVALFARAGAKSFPAHPEHAVRHAVALIVGDRAELSIEDVRPGSYAIAALHDEDLDLEMDRNLLGLPKEGLALSQDREWRMGLPKFERAQFEVTEPEARVSLRMRYL